MPWKQLTFEVPDALKDAVIGEIGAWGAAGIWESGTPSRDVTELTAYFESGASLEAARLSLQTLFDRAGLPPLRAELRSVEARDWGEEWKKTWSSFPIGSRFYVVPSWSSGQSPADKFPLFIDPGQAFGTGTHETTQLTLEAMERYIAAARIVMDVGTGSGLLAIAAAIIGAPTVWACDTDPLAIEVARENTARNAPGRVGLFCGSADALNAEVADLVLCNLTADVIEAIFADIDRVLRPQGTVVFSGILDFQAQHIREITQQFGHSLIEETPRGEWRAITTRKNGS
jgi:ribosomal protein L11 methyltransferase